MFNKKIARRIVNREISGLEVYPKLLQRIFSSRNIQDAKELDLSIGQLHDFQLLSGIDAATEYLIQAIKNNEKVTIVGDFDADGATSTALLMLALPEFGLKNINYIVPNRFEFGYGLTPEIVEIIASDKPNWIVTVDNGISSHAGVERAQALGIKVMVTDHHLPGEVLPNAEVIVNPNLQNDSFPSKNLAGVGVAFYLLIALRAGLRAEGYFESFKIPEPNLANYLDIVALGTVADVVPLDANNRRLIQFGLQRIRAGRCRPGILALLNSARRDHSRVVASDLGFAVGPRLNAAGRLEDMSVGIECLLASDSVSAKRLAVELDGLNQYRREIEAEMVEDALHKVMADFESNSERQNGYCLYHADWHQGVVGLVASRIKERVNRPIIAFAKENEQTLKGSGRSVEGVHLRDLLVRIATKQPKLITKFGGHAMAAGLSIPYENLESFRQVFTHEMDNFLAEQPINEELLTDGELTGEYFTLEWANKLRDAGPWGQCFPEPAFDGLFNVVNYRIVGTKHLKLVVEELHSSICLDAIYFNPPTHLLEESLDRVKMVYRLDVNSFRNQESVQLMVHQLEPMDLDRL